MSTTTAPAVSDTTRLTIVKLLAAGRDTTFVATATELDVDTVTHVGSAHGYPDRAKLAWAADVLVANVNDAARAAIPVVTPPRGPSARPVAPRPRPADDVDETPDERDDVRGLIARGAKSDRPSTRKLAEKADIAVDALREALAGDEAARRETARLAAEKARAQAEVQRLEKELAEARRRLGTTASPTKGAKGTHGACARAGLDPKTVRTWADANGVELRGSGRIPTSVVEAYQAAHGGAR